VKQWNADYQDHLTEDPVEHTGLSFHNVHNPRYLYITGHNTKLFEKSTTYSGIHIYNRLANEIKNTEILTKFKKKLIDFLTEECFYSVEEFLNC
jgi:hypothetical protein